jgi:hypothetical protein
VARKTRRNRANPQPIRNHFPEDYLSGKAEGTIGGDWVILALPCDGFRHQASGKGRQHLGG